MSFDFQTDLFTLEMANNHQGDLEHAAKIIAEMAEIAHTYQIRAAIKLQLRHLPTFIHKDYADHSNKHINRFNQTSLDETQFAQIVEMIRKHKLIPMATVFDEESMGLFQRLDFEILKIASCSAQDYPLLTQLSKLDAPKIISTASLTMEQIRLALGCLDSNPSSTAIMHCVGIYPTPEMAMLLDRIDEIKTNFPGYAVGFSTHESPDSKLPVQIAAAKGVRLFEKHVDVPSDSYKVNAYSASPSQVRQWLDAYFEAKKLCSTESQDEVNKTEQASLRSLKRAAFARRKLEAGQTLTPSDVQLAIPAQQGQILADDFLPDSSLKLLASIEVGEPIYKTEVATTSKTNSAEPGLHSNYHGPKTDHYVKKSLQVVKQAGLVLPSGYELELSHHYGIEEFEQKGATLVTVLKNHYLKKLIVLYAGQMHPCHYHADRDESLCLVQGKADLFIDGRQIPMKAHEYYHLTKGTKHEIRAHEDTVIEEISIQTPEQHSRYLDEAIEQQNRSSRKTRAVPNASTTSRSPAANQPRGYSRDLEQ